MIRLWRLGSLEHKLIPTRQSVDKLAKILEAEKKGETVDIIWGPDLEVVVIKDDGSIERV